MKNIMKSKENLNRKLFAVVATMCVCVCMIFSGTVKTYAWSNTKTRKAYSEYYKSSMGTLEARIWVSVLSRNLSNTKITFDAKSSSWVFKANKNITKHVNTLTLKKAGVTGSLSVSPGKTGTTVGVTIAEQTDSVCSLATTASNTYYRGITTYNNTITRGVAGTIIMWTIPALSYLVVTGTSNQSVCLDGQFFNNVATVSAYF